MKKGPFSLLGGLRRSSGGGAAGKIGAELAACESIWRRLRPWLLYREEDEVLILPPNRVFKLGGSGPRLFAWLEAGGKLAELPGMDEGRSAEIRRFFTDLELAAAGKTPAAGFERLPYDFDFSRLPILGELALSYRCNARCRFCYASCSESPDIPAGGRKGRGELRTEEARRVIRIFKEEAKIPFFSFTGGEPLLRTDLEELAAYAVSLGLKVNLITNGTLVDPDRARGLRAAGIETAQVSLESPEREVHDALVGLPGAFERTCSGIAALREAGVSVQTNTTITRLNLPSLAGLPAFLAGLGIGRFSCNLFIPSGRGLEHEELLLPYEELGPVVESLRRAAAAAGLDFLWYSPTPYCLYNPLARGLGNKSCAALDGLLHVNPRGDILPCSSWNEAVGNILERPFKEIWLGERSRYFKEKRFAPALCRDCPSFVACQGACPLYWKSVGESGLAALKAAKNRAYPESAAACREVCPERTS